MDWDEMKGAYMRATQDDIVTRLREDYCYLPECNWLMGDAADEIERLRADRDIWRKLALAEHWLRVPNHLACDCLEKAVRGA